MAGNAMHIRAIAAATAVALRLSDFGKLVKFCKKV
jgi:hypothetical protein